MGFDPVNQVSQGSFRTPEGFSPRFTGQVINLIPFILWSGFHRMKDQYLVYDLRKVNFIDLA